MDLSQPQEKFEMTVTPNSSISAQLSLLWFQRNPLPTDWVAQRRVVAGFDA